MVRINGKFIVILLISLGFALLEGGSFPFIIFYGLFSVFLTGFIYIGILRYSIHAEVSFKKKIKSAGDSVNYLTVISNRNKLPVPYMALENTILSNGCSGHYKQIYNMGFGESVNIESDIKFYQRGVYNLGCLSIRIMDIFRIFQSQKKVDCEEFIRVYPKIYNIKSLPLGGRDVERVSFDPISLSEDIFSVKDIRKYREGDNIGRISWKVSARHDELYVKNPETISGGELVIFLDMNKDNINIDPHGITEENMIDLCMSLTNHMVSEGIKTRIHINSKNPLMFNIDSREGFCSLMEFMILQKSDGFGSIGQFIHDNYRRLQKQNPMVVIAGNVDDGMASAAIDIKNSGYNVNVLYCSDSLETLKNTGLLNKSGIGCLSFYDVIQRQGAGGEISESDAAQSI